MFTVTRLQLKGLDLNSLPKCRSMKWGGCMNKAVARTDYIVPVLFLAATPVMEMEVQQHSSVQYITVKNDLITPSIPHLKAPVFDPSEEV
jgi:hypothetical protein